MGLLDRTVLWMFAITALSNSAYALIAPFLPFEFERLDIPLSVVGYIFSVYSLAVILSSPLIGKMIQNYGRRSIMRLGIQMMGFSFILFSLLSHVRVKSYYITAAIMIRFIQGFASSCIQTTCYSIATNFYP